MSLGRLTKSIIWESNLKNEEIPSEAGEEGSSMRLKKVWAWLGGGGGGGGCHTA